MCYRHRYAYSAQITDADGKIKEVSGEAIIETDQGSLKDDLLLKCKILEDKVRLVKLRSGSKVVIHKSTRLSVKHVVFE